MFTNASEWAVLTFGKCQLGDKRRTQRLIKMATNMADHVGSSVVKSCPDAAHVEGSYRLIRNEDVTAEAIAEGGFEATADLAQNYNELLALEDTTSLSYRHSIADDLGYTTSSLSNRTKGMFAHSVLLYAPGQEHTVGLIEQRRWIRDEESYGSRHHNQKRDYKVKESYKWELASEAVNKRLGAQMGKCISVCDREADVIEYLAYKQQHKQRFVVRAKSNRPLSEGDRLYDHAAALTPAGEYTVNVPQKGGRSARQATMNIRYAPVSVLAPTRKQPLYPAISTYVVYCDEVTEQSEGSSLQWVLLTTEPVTCTEDALKIVNYYETRWKVELFHKVWKTEGTKVESLRMQEVNNLERVMVIQAFVAIRLMQLKDIGDSSTAESTPCTRCLSDVQWRVLFISRNKRRKMPVEAPSMRWAYHSLGRLGGWKDTKRTGRVSWKSLWEGWEKLDLLVTGYELYRKEM